ncbi:MAG: DNA polymerase III subunit delta' [Micrococcales bacterium]|nr:MAG: DNA polymerase III subunit delta' [Micrococcales bacterium]
MSPETVAGGVWARLVGQSHVVEQLRRAAATAAQFQGGHLDRAPAHAWLFTGPPGSGRSTAARAFAAALHCELAGTDAAGCGRCQGCRTTLAGSHPDVSVTVSQGSVLRAADVRPLIQLAQRAPTSGGWRVLIIEDADRLNDTSGNALLKAIEEPPERTLWLLCAPSVADVLVTIRSRCRSITLRTPPVADVADLLVRTHGIDPAMAAYAARAAQSHVGRARRLATDEQARIRRRDVVSLAFGLRGVGDAVLRAGHLVEVASEEAAAATTDRDAAEKADLLRALGYQEQTRLPPSVRAQVRDLETEQKRRAARFKRDMLDLALTDLASVYRDVAMLQLGASVELVNPTERAEISALARTSTPAHTLARLDAIATARTRLTSTNVNPLLAVEAMAIQLVGHEYGG